jgi:hypothetical protein
MQYVIQFPPKATAMVTSLHPTLPPFTEHWQAQKEILNIIYRC